MLKSHRIALITESQTNTNSIHINAYNYEYYRAVWPQICLPKIFIDYLCLNLHQDDVTEFNTAGRPQRMQGPNLFLIGQIGPNNTMTPFLLTS